MQKIKLRVENAIEKNKFHYLVENFLNGYTLDNASKILFPILDNNNVKSQIFNFSNMPALAIAKFICSYYAEKREDSTMEKNDHAVIAIVLKKYEEWLEEFPKNDQSALAKIQKLRFESLKMKEIKQLILHGSYSTLDYTNYSDLDAMLVINSKALESPVELLNLRSKIINLNKILREFDVLQHHGFFITFTHELEGYYSHWLPIEVLRNSTALIGSTNLEMTMQRVNQFEREILMQHLDYLAQKMQATYLNAYEFKTFTSVVQQIPAYYFQYISRPVYKKNSFQTFKKTSLPQKAIEIATKIRQSYTFDSQIAKKLLLAPTYWLSTIYLRLFTKVKIEEEFKIEVAKLVSELKKELEK